MWKAFGDGYSGKIFVHSQKGTILSALRSEDKLMVSEDRLWWAMVAWFTRPKAHHRPPVREALARFNADICRCSDGRLSWKPKFVAEVSRMVPAEVVLSVPAPDVPPEPLEHIITPPPQGRTYAQAGGLQSGPKLNRFSQAESHIASPSIGCRVHDVQRQSACASPADGILLPHDADTHSMCGRLRLYLSPLHLHIYMIQMHTCMMNICVEICNTIPCKNGLLWSCRTPCKLRTLAVHCMDSMHLLTCMSRMCGSGYMCRIFRTSGKLSDRSTTAQCSERWQRPVFGN